VLSLELLAPEAGAALLPLALLDWSVEGVLLDELELGLADEPELGVDEDELELEGVLGVTVAEPDIELEPDAGGVLAPEDDEDDGLDGAGALELDEDEPADDLSERAPGPPGPLSQP